MNAPTLIIIVAIAILMVFALRRAYRVFSLKDDCCGGGPKAGCWRGCGSIPTMRGR